MRESQQSQRQRSQLRRNQPQRARRPAVASYATRLVLLLLVWALAAGAADSRAQELIANDDRYGIPYGLPLVVEPFGVLENDRLDGESAGENGATAVLVSDVSHGTLVLNEDGSFSYEPGVGFDGSDLFVYRAEFGAVWSEATVVVSACEGGPDLFTCWHEGAFLEEIGALGYGTFIESFEDDAVWGGVRTPQSAPEVVSQGIAWTSNHPDPPAENPISTTSGPPHTGLWAVYDPEHGYATGTPGECDVDNPPEHCLYHDGVTGRRESGVLYGVGGYVNGIYGARLAIILDDGPLLGGGVLGSGHQFFGAIQTAGFSKFQFRELDGKVGQALYVWADDFIMATDDPVSVPTEPLATGSPRALRVTPNPIREAATLRFSLEVPSRVSLSIHGPDGRLVRSLLEGVAASGEHSVAWNALDSFGERVPVGVYFARLTTERSAGGVTGTAIIVLE